MLGSCVYIGGAYEDIVINVNGKKKLRKLPFWSIQNFTVKISKDIWLTSHKKSWQASNDES